MSFVYWDFGIDGLFLKNMGSFWRFNLSTTDVWYLIELIMNERVNDFENICIKCGKMYSEHPTIGRFNTVTWCSCIPLKLL